MVPFSQVSKEKTCKGSKQRSDDILPPVKFQSRKRVFAQGPPTDRETRSKKSKTQIDAILSPPSRDNDDTQAVVEG
jgi:hypothetical protein